MRPDIQAIFEKRTKAIYYGMRKRAKTITPLTFGLDDFRKWLTSTSGDKFSFGPSGIARCFYSGDLLAVEDFTIDHRCPISRGGGFGLDNLAICSEKQNLRKGIMTESEYISFKRAVSHYPYHVQQDIWGRLEIGDVARFSHYRREAKRKAAKG